MDVDDCTINSNCLVSVAVNERLKKAGYKWQTSPTGEVSHKLIKAVSELCSDFETRFEKTPSTQFNDMSIEPESFEAVYDSVIEGGIHWGRIVAILTFAGIMSLQSMKEGREQDIDLIREWTSLFIHSKVESWVKVNGGWKALIQFYEEGKQRTEVKDESSGGWNKLLLGALAIGGISALIMNKA